MCVGNFSREMLITHFQLCLAHYCDLHGPTPLMVTEGLPVPCSVCYENDIPLGTITGAADDRPRTGVATGSPYAVAAVTEVLRRMNFTSAQRSSSVPASEQEAQTHRAALLRSAQLASAASAVESPPQSPRQFSGQLSEQQRQQLVQPSPSLQTQSKPRPESGFRRTYDEYVTRRAGPCENCALTLPRRQESPDSPNRAGMESQTDRGPTLRTRAPCARVYASGTEESSPMNSQPCSSSPSDDEASQAPRGPSHRRTGTTVSSTSRSTASTSSAANAHMHYLDYTSTHEPVIPASFSMVRASCLRTLSLETLPRPPATGFAGAPSTQSTPTASPVTPAFVTTHSAGAAASGGPIFFGDPAAGYTTAYIFRIPDVHARGHKRVYAFLALSTHRERLAMKSFGFIAAAFREMAAWIQAMAELEAERANSDGGSSSASSPITANPSYGGFGTQSEPVSQPQSTGGSSFLTGGMGGMSRRMGGGFGGSGVLLKQRGLAELVGLPDFFIELHSRFVRLLLELGVVLGS
jgi:hypothetical protein